MVVFARVVQAGSFTAAARSLGMPKSTVSRRVAELEARLDARLLQRTTRKLGLTDAGRTYFEYCARIASDVEDAERAVSSLSAAPRGLLRITTGVNAEWLGDIVTGFMRRHPDVQLEILCTGRQVDLVEERFDVGIRAGTLADSTLIARSLGRLRWFLVATPAYLKKHGRPKTPDELTRHACLLFGARSPTVTLAFESEANLAEVTLSARLLVSDMDLVHAAAVAGLGIALLPAYRCVDGLRAKAFERVLRDWNAPSTPMHVVYPSTRHLSAKVKLFVEYLQERMTPPPWELGPRP